MLVAAAAMAFTSCQKEETAAPETVSATLTMHAGVEETKTYLENNAVLWGKGEAVTLYVGSGETAKFFDSASTDAYDGKESASFTFEIKDVTGADSYALGGIYPASAAKGINDNDNPKSYKVALPATQNAEPGKYDPSAYIMVLKPEAVDQLPTEYAASFRRAVALNKITLTNVKEDISTVEITVPNTKYLAGRRSFDLTTGESGDVYENGGRTNTIKVNSAYSAGTIDVWFTSWGVELAAGQELTVKMISPSKIYTRTITAKEGGIKFVEGYLNKLTVNMASATEEVNTDLSGDYLIASVPKSWNLMSGTNSNDFYTHIASGVTTTATDVKCSDFYSVAEVNDCVWTVEKMGDNYSIKNNTTGKYVSYTGNDNKAYTSEEPVEFILSEKDGVMTVESKAVSGRKLKYNSSSPRFAFYSTDQTPLYFIPWTADTTPRIYVDKKNYEVEAAAGSVDVVYTTNDIVSKPIDASVKSGATMSISSVTVSDGKVTVNYDANTAQQSKTATIVLSYDGAESQEVVITQAAAGVTKQYYVKVTTAPTDLSGTYLMVCDSKKMVLSSISTTSTKYGVGTAVTITDSKIEATETLASYQVVLSPGATSGSYLMKFKGSYLYWNSGNSLATNANNNTNTNWIISVSSGNATIKNCMDNTRVIGWNASSPRFACYTSSQTAIQLYKLEDGNAGGETPEPEQPTLTSRNLAFSSTTATATVGQPFTAPTLNGEIAGVTYSSSKTSVATVDASTGAVTIVAAGTTTITATAPATDQYEAGEASYTLTVSAAQGGDTAETSYVKVTATPSDWSGTYLIVYESGATAYVYNGTDSGAKNYVSATISDNHIARSSAVDAVAVQIAKSGSGYSIKVPNGKYISGGTSNGTTFNTSAVANTITLNTNGTVKINNNTTTSFQFNSASDQMRFRYFKSAQKSVYLYKLN